MADIKYRCLIARIAHTNSLIRFKPVEKVMTLNSLLFVRVCDDAMQQHLTGGYISATSWSSKALLGCGRLGGWRLHPTTFGISPYWFEPAKLLGLIRSCTWQLGCSNPAFHIFPCQAWTNFSWSHGEAPRWHRSTSWWPCSMRCCSEFSESTLRSIWQSLIVSRHWNAMDIGSMHVHWYAQRSQH